MMIFKIEGFINVTIQVPAHIQASMQDGRQELPWPHDHTSIPLAKYLDLHFGTLILN